VALVLLPQISYLPLWAGALSLALLAWRLWMARTGRSLPSKWLLAALLALAVGATVLQFRSIVGPQAGVVLVALLLVLKTLEMRARRDAMVIFFLGFFSLLGLLLHSQSLPMAAGMLIAVWALLAALVNAHMPAGYPSLRQLLRTSGLLMVLGTPVMLLLFVSFPRMAPLWNLPNPTSSQGSSGLASRITVGQVAALAHNRDVALRVRFDLPQGQQPPQRLLYFRGPVLSHFDGRNWQAMEGIDAQPLAPDSAMPAVGLGPAISYEITLEPHQQRWLLALDATVQRPNTTLRSIAPTADLQWISAQPIREVQRIQAQVHWHYVYGQQLTSSQLAPWLALPTDLNPRTQAWAQHLRQLHGSDDTAILQAALARLSAGDYRYTLQPGEVVSEHTADDFWFERQQGFCEHIASAFVVLMRAAGIPARIVAGYQGGERNPVDGLWTVRQSDAHAWAEVWLPHEGWMRIDPTSAVSPARTEQTQRLPAPTGTWNAALQGVMGHQLQNQLQATWEAIDHAWNDWVLNYSRSDQQQMARHLGLTRWDAAKAALWLSALVALVLLGTGVQRWWLRRQPDPWLRLMARARRKLQHAGIAHADSLGLQALAHAAQAQWGDESQPLQQWLLQMEQWRYAPHGPHTLSLASLRRSYRALTWPRPRSP